MVSKLLFFRPSPLSLRTLFPESPLLQTPILSLLSTSTITTTSLQPITSTLNPSYGPSLHRGRPPPHHRLHHQLQPSEPFTGDAEQQAPQEKEEDFIFDKSAFTRVFDIAAIRVPSAECFTLENRLRGHLLNWPRVRNIARVPGDEMEDEFANLVGKTDNGASDERDDSGLLVSSSRRLYGKAEGDGELLGPVLYREKLANTFNSRGFVKFRNLAKISRPKKTKRKTAGEGGEGRKRGTGKNDIVMVEVVEDEEVGEDLSGLLGEEFNRRQWRGPTRLLLLDEKYADSALKELPEAIKALLHEGIGKRKPLDYELVKCKLTLFYAYWQMNEILETLLPKGVLVPSAYETVGHIAHLNLRDEHLPYKKLIAKVVLDKNRPKIQTVVNKVDTINNDYRTMQLEVLAGNHSLVATVVENGIHFQVDLANVYWNSRLATERQRLVNSFTHKDILCDVFSGVGPIAISAARKVKRVYANDLNPQAVEYLERNSVLNRLEKRIQVFNMDARRFIDVVFLGENANSITQVVMNLPNDATEYLDAFRGIYNKKSTDRETIFPRIHVYGFSKATDPEFEFHERIRIGLSEAAVDVEMRKVRLVAPGKWMLCASFILPESVAYGRRVLNN